MGLRLTFFSFITIIIWPLSVRGQALNDKILMSVEGREVEAGEFIRMYKKSLQPSDSGSLDSYLEQFIIFRLKVAEALDADLDTTRSFKNELSSYRSQLAQNYLTEPRIKEILLKKAYERSLTDINATHILVSCPPDASPEDTLKAWKKATDIRQRILNGEAFEQVARSTSDDKSVLQNGGNLGYFTVFQMIMPFEDAAYSLKQGSVSLPVRSSYGYHIIKVIGRRPSQGRIKVAHIMKSAPPGTDEKKEKEVEEGITGIYNQIQKGASFSELAKKYSDHKLSAAAGGELDWFGTGELINDLSEAAFALKDTGHYSKPVRTIYGWHIIKLLDKKAPGTLEESRSFLESKINQSYLNSLSKKTLVSRLKKEYKFRINQPVYEWFIQNTDTLIIRGLMKYEKDSIPSGNLYSFAGQHFTARDFADYIDKGGSGVSTEDPGYFISSNLESRVSDHIIFYENSMLGEKYPDFRYLMNEFHDGILLFEITEKMVWNRAVTDTTGLERYYDEHKNEFLTRAAIEGKIYSLKGKKADKKLTSAYRKYSGKPDADEKLRKKFNKNSDSLLVIKEGKWYAGDNDKIDAVKWETGTHLLNKNGSASLLFISRVHEPVPLEFEDVQGEMISGYQEWLMDGWIKQLKNKYSVKIDQSVLNEVKKELNNE